MKKGMLITFEGLDAAGKDTQTKLAAAYLEKRNLPYRLLSFPTYDGRMSALVQMYLRGEFGSDPKAVNAYAASSFFAMDRYASYMTDWKKDYERGAVLLANRYTTSNAIHQLSKLPEAEWEGFLNWLYDYEYGLLGIPKPDRVLFLRVPPRCLSVWLKNAVPKPARPRTFTNPSCAIWKPARKRRNTLPSVTDG